MCSHARTRDVARAIFPPHERRRAPERRVELAIERVAGALELQLGLHGGVTRGAALFALVRVFFGRRGARAEQDRR